MERESFEDPEVAALMNERFVCIKVDREERPDVDAIYMDAVQAMTGRGGWPLNAFLTPDGVPFYAGTYFPPEPRARACPRGRRSLLGVAEAWGEQRAEIEETGRRILPRLAGAAALAPAEGELDPAGLDARRRRAAARLRLRARRLLDERAEVPAPPRRSSSCSRRGERADGAAHAARDGRPARMYDQVGGGFARYSVDARWVIPHFEKMLYDNALLARAYLHGCQVSGEPFFARVCTETLDWALRDLRQDEGGFASALDADSEGEEGRFYVWTPDEVRAALGRRGARRGGARRTSASTGPANFEGRWAPVRADERPGAARRDQGAAARGARAARLAGARRQAADRLERADDLRARRRRRGARARRTTATPPSPAPSSSGATCATPTAGCCAPTTAARRGCGAYLEDHAFLLEALLTLYEATFDPRWFAAARELAETILARFADPEHGGFFATADDHEALVARRKELEDAPIPSGASAAAFGLLRLAALTGEHRYEEAALGVLRLLHGVAPQHPAAFGHLLQALDFHLAAVKEVAIVGPGAEPLERVVRGAFRPHLVLAGGPADGVPLLEGREPVDGRAAAYVCERFACRRPVTEPGELAALL